MKAWVVALALGLAGLGTAARADTHCDGLAKGDAGEVKVSLVFDAAGQNTGVLYDWRVRSPGTIRLSAASWDQPLEGRDQSAALPGQVKVEASGSAQLKARTVTLEVSVDGRPPLRSFADTPDHLVRGDPKVFYDTWLYLDSAAVMAAGKIEVTVRGDGQVIEQWTFQNDNGARQALNAVAVGQARSLAATPLACQAMSTGSVIVKPDWLRRPSMADLARAYPPRAKAERLGGRAVMACDVTGDGLLVYCAVESETPEGAGFGQAVLALAPSFRLKPQTLDGSPVGGARVRIPVQFSPPG